MQLLDLPSEILIRIWESLGPSELRTNVNYLLICKRLYNAGVQVYLSGLSELRLSAYDVELLPPFGSPLLRVFQGEVVHLSIYLDQTLSRKVATTPFIEGPEVPQSDDEASIESIAIEKEAKSSDSRDGTTFSLPGQGINPRLSDLADQLASSFSLRSFSLEVMAEVMADSEWLPYILHARTFAKILRSLPPGLRSVHLDLCGTNAVAYETDNAHICPILGARLGDFESVRLRLRCICPELIRSSGPQGRLQKLIIRLNQPMLSDFTGDQEYFDAKLCSSQCLGSESKELLKDMVLAGVAKGRQLAKDMFRISFRIPGKSSIDVELIDCISNQRLFKGSAIFCYEEEGCKWDFWEESDSLLPGINFDWQTTH
ncbi:MAG: hypothetical protein Q9191_006708 [Dirinaria sp. TL-2023a]